MEKISTIFERDVYPDKEQQPHVVYEDRLTCKVILLNSRNEIGLVGTSKNTILQLPGGGVHDTETPSEAARRECREEMGCDIEILDEVGYIDDYRPRDKKHCITYCYVARVAGSELSPAYTEKETGVGMYPKWVSLARLVEIFDAQRALLREGKITFYNTGFNVLRDSLFLGTAKSVLHQYE